MMTHPPSYRARLGAQSLLLSAMGLGVLACQPEPDPPQLAFAPAGENNAPDPSTFGPFAVGVRTLHLSDPSRTAPGGDGPRAEVTEVWYPARIEDGAETEDYDLWEYLPESQREQIPQDALGVVTTTAVRDADVDDRFGPYPLIIFSHGKGGIRMQSTFYTVLLASHGYVVASPDHQGDTIVELLEEGDVEASSTVESFIDRPLDVSFLISAFEDETVPADLAAIADMERVGVTGHSFGALTTFRAAGNDARVRAIVAQTPVGISLVNASIEVPVEDFTIPAMIQAAGLDATLPAELHADSLWEAMPRPRYYLTLKNAGHYTYSDLCVLDVEKIDEALPNFDVSNVLGDGCGEGFVSPEVAFPTINYAAVGFFNGYLRDSFGARAQLNPGALTTLGGADEVTFIAEP